MERRFEERVGSVEMSRRPGATSSLAIILGMIKFEHTLFALPFAFLGMILAAEGWPAWSQVFWIVVAMIGARSAAMAFNRLADRDLDAANPRTSGRALPAGLVSPVGVVVFVVAGLAILVLAAWRLDPLALRLSPVAIAVILLYSYSKRFTLLCHLILGLGISGAPLGAWIAVRGEVSLAPVVLAAAVLFWVAGFDVLYGLQDLEFDRHRGLHSIPATFGVTGALWLSALLHLAMLVLLAMLPRVYAGELGLGYWLGFAGCAALLLYQHWTVRPYDLSRLDAAFFQANGALAVWLFLTTTIGILLR